MLRMLGMLFWISVLNSIVEMFVWKSARWTALYVCMYEQRVEAEGRKHGHSRTCWRQSAYVRRWRSTPTCVQRESQSSSSTICTKRTSRVLSTNWTASATVQFIPSSGCILCRPTTATKSAAAPAGKCKHKSYIGPCSIGFWATVCTRTHQEMR